MPIIGRYFWNLLKVGNMKRPFLLTYFLLISIFTYSQCDSLLIGKWRIISTYSGTVYMNVKDDSSFIPKDSFLKDKDSVSQRDFVKANIAMFKKLIYEMDKDKCHTYSLDSSTNFSVNYCFMRSKDLIKYTISLKSGEIREVYSIAKIENGLLSISSQPGKPYYQIVFERIY